MMFQSAWRCRKARKKVNELKDRKRRLMEEACAMKLQSRWRIRKAQKRVNGMRAQRDSKASTAVQRIWRGRQDRMRYKKMKAAILKIQCAGRKLISIVSLFNKIRQLTPQVLVIQLENARDINIADIKTSDPYIVATTYNTALANGPALSLNKSKVISSTLAPVWNESIHLPLVNIDSQIALTLFDSDAVGKDDFLGQVSLLRLRVNVCECVWANDKCISIYLYC